MQATSAEEIRQLLRQGEGPHVELKTRFTGDRLIARHVSAFANSGGGTLIIGVSDKGEVLGLEPDEEKQTLDRLKRLAESLLPIFVYSLGSVQIDGKSVVYLNVDEAPESERPIRVATGDTLVMRDGVTVEVSQAQRAVTPSRLVKVFVAMSLRNEEEPALVDYFEAMQRAKDATKLPIELVRIDLVEGDYEISQKIMDEIDKCDVVLADFTLSPANVYFELGYARGRKRRIIQTARKGATLEFDARNWRTIFYRNATELEKALKPALNDAYAEVTKDSK
jgi:nucleoside 2-deoxyribosyltransferase